MFEFLLFGSPSWVLAVALGAAAIVPGLLVGLVLWVERRLALRATERALQTAWAEVLVDDVQRGHRG